MSHSADHSHHVRRVVLPSGKAIEVVYFDAPADAVDVPAPAPNVADRTVHEGLHVCPSCEAHLVYPIEWQEVTATHWEVELRCPNCEWIHVGTYEQSIVDQFDDDLDRGTAALVRDLKCLTQANMEEEIERFRLALSSDAIWPMDF